MATYDFLLGAAIGIVAIENLAKPILSKLFNDSYDAAKAVLAPSIGNVLSKLDDKIKVLSYLDDALDAEDELNGREKLIVREAVLEAFSLKVNIDKELTQNKVDK